MFIYNQKSNLKMQRRFFFLSLLLHSTSPPPPCPPPPCPPLSSSSSTSSLLVLLLRSSSSSSSSTSSSCSYRPPLPLLFFILLLPLLSFFLLHLLLLLYTSSSFSPVSIKLFSIAQDKKVRQMTARRGRVWLRPLYPLANPMYPLPPSCSSPPLLMTPSFTTTIETEPRARISRWKHLLIFYRLFPEAREIRTNDGEHT